MSCQMWSALIKNIPRGYACTPGEPLSRPALVSVFFNGPSGKWCTQKREMKGKALKELYKPNLI